ncbi:hypothetical protein FXN61_22075 [Lentzea sp. PSKA42]|uniref:Band 7 domain-containing protein n=1 Tax=Lentzea indica TaxID=2604800 RepID=A0ABX1FK81_9PSEU|nr:SPFH domain-containing protein [Lentzea indica]NKE59350.1 hypothetical protein [Lentzea indica]
MIVTIVVFVLLAALFIGLAAYVLRRMRHLPVHRFAVVTRRWVLPQPNLSPEQDVLRRTHIRRGGQVLPLWPWLYDIREHDYVSVPVGTVGLVKARMGASVPASRELATHVECDHFQDIAKFLAHGEKGVQPALLRGGEQYAIAPELFDVYTVDNLPDDFSVKDKDLHLLSVDGEDVGVVIVTGAPPPDDLDLPAPSVEGHENFQKPWVFLANGGRSGPQTDILPGGAKYAINPLFARVVHIPTRELTLTWGEKSGSEDRYDSELGPLRVTIQGFELEVDLSQTLSIPPHAAPHLVKRFGEEAQGDVGDRKSTAVKRFVGRVLGEKVKGYFTERTSGGEIDKFIHGLADVRVKLMIQISQALSELQVNARETTIGAIRFASDELNHEYRKFVQREQQFRQLEQELANQHVINDIQRKQLEVRREELIAHEQALSDLYGLDRRALERLQAIIGSANQPTVIVNGGATSAVPIAPQRPAERITVPTFDPMTELDVFDISPGVLPPAEGGKKPGDAT